MLRYWVSTTTFARATTFRTVDDDEEEEEEEDELKINSLRVTLTPRMAIPRHVVLGKVLDVVVRVVLRVVELLRRVVAVAAAGKSHTPTSRRPPKKEAKKCANVRQMTATYCQLKVRQVKMERGVRWRV